MAMRPDLLSNNFANAECTARWLWCTISIVIVICKFLWQEANEAFCEGLNTAISIVTHAATVTMGCVPPGRRGLPMDLGLLIAESGRASGRAELLAKRPHGRLRRLSAELQNVGEASGKPRGSSDLFELFTE